MKFIFLIGLFFCGKITAQTIGGQKQPAQSNKGDISIVKFDSSGKTLAVGYDLGTVEIWDLNPGHNTLMGIQSQIQGPICSIDFLDNLNQVLVVYQFGRIVFLNKQTGTVSKTFNVQFNEYYNKKPESVFTSVFDSTKRILAIAGNMEGRIVLINVDSLYNGFKSSKDNIYTLHTRNSEWEIEPDKNGTSASVLGVLSGGKFKQDRCIIANFVLHNDQHLSDDQLITCIKISSSLHTLFAGTKGGAIIKWHIRDTSGEVLPEKLLPLITAGHKADYQDILGIDCTDSVMVSVGFGTSRVGDFQIWDPSDVSLIGYKKEGDFSTCRRIVLSSNGQIGISTGDFSYRIWRKTGDDFILFKDIKYKSSVGYDTKFAGAAIFNNKLVALGDKNNVYFFDMDGMQYLNNLRGSADHLDEENYKDGDPETVTTKAPE